MLCLAPALTSSGAGISRQMDLAMYEEDDNVRTPETQPSKRRRKKSIVWEYFTIENVSPGIRRACCKQCNQTFAYSQGSKVAGTSHLKRHIAKGTCPLLRNRDRSHVPQLSAPVKMVSDAPKRRFRTSPAPYIPFDQDRCRQEIAKMIIMHDYPLHVVEQPGFVSFVQNLQPRFDLVSFSSIQGDCIATYLSEKQRMMNFIGGMPGRCCLTVDLWTSSQNLGYLLLTGHFMDHDWTMQSRLLNVVLEPFPESDTALSHVIATCLGDWNLDGKLFSITCNQALTQAGRENLRAFLANKNPSIFSGQLLLGNCIARTLSTVAKDMLLVGEDIIQKVRNSVKYVKTSESHEEKFDDLREQLQVPSDKTLALDDQTRWNTTCEMLMAASELKEVFSCLDTSDPEYKDPLSPEVWKQVEILCTYLKPIHEAASILITTSNPTATTFFHEVWKIQADLARAVTSDDPFVTDLTKPMLEKIDRYWKDCSLVLAMAIVMDPRFKIKLVEFSFTKIFGEEAPNYVKQVEDGIRELFLEYVSLQLTPRFSEEVNMGSSARTDELGAPLLTDHGLMDFDVYIMETTGQDMKSELDQYLDENLSPRVPDFDLLGWWRTNEMKYPILSKVARDILSIPVSTVPLESVFDLTNREMDRYKCSLRPEALEALLCAKDWLQYGSAQISDALVEVELSA